MIAGATRGAGGSALARHLLKRQGGQEVTVMPGRNLAAEDLPGQLRELVAIAARGRTSRPVHHLHVDPPPDCTDPDSVIATFLDHYEREFGLEDAQRCGVFHTKGGRKHAHVVWSLVREDGSVVSLAHDHARREKISRIVEFEHGLPMTKGKHNRSAARALRAEGRADVAVAMEAAGLLSGKRPVAHSTPRQRAQAERTAVTLDEIRTQTLAAWKVSDDAMSFAVALHSWGSIVAAGERGLVLVDRAGGTHSLNRVLAAAAREAGEDKITAAAVRRRLAGIVFPSVEEAKNARSSRQNSEHDDNHAREHREVASAPGPLERAGRRNAGSNRRIESPVGHDHRNPEVSERSLAKARKRLRDLVAVQQIKTLDLQAINQTKGEIMKRMKAQSFKAKIFAEIAPRGFNVHAFSDDLRMVQKPTPARPNARVMTNDGGWVEIDSARNIVRTWGASGRAQVLAVALAAIMGVEVERLEKTVAIAANADALKVAKLSEDKIKSLAQWWMARGYTATSAPDGAWVNVGGARLHDIGDKITVHGSLTDDVVAAMILKCKDAWHGRMELVGSWNQGERDRFWIAAQRAGVEIFNCRPSKKIQDEWAREQDRAITQSRTVSAVRSEMVDAQDVIAAAHGDKNSVIRLPGDLQAFIAIYLDDDQRKHLAAQSVADIIPELARFRELGAAELESWEKRTGRKFTPPTPDSEKRGEENRLVMQ
jgi:hypothetical protein